jgi:hypothetical protein
VNSRDNNFTQGKIQRRQKQIEESVARYMSQLDVTGISAPPRARLGSERYWRPFSDIGRRLGGNFHA